MRSRESDFLTPDLTPLIDVVFLLLIFFLVSSVLKKNDLSLLLKLPSAQTGKIVSQSDKKIAIEVSNQGVAVNGEKVTERAFESIVKTFSKDSTVFLSADTTTSYGKVIQIFDLLRKNKILNVSLETESANK